MNDYEPIGHVISSNSSRFMVGASVSALTRFPLGGLIKTAKQNQAGLPSVGGIYGLVYYVEAGGDPLIESVARRPDRIEAVIADQLRNRNVTLTCHALIVGFSDGNKPAYSFPSSPPNILDGVTGIVKEEARAFLSSPLYLTILVQSSQTVTPLPQLFGQHFRYITEMGTRGIFLRNLDHIMDRLRNDVQSARDIAHAINANIPVDYFSEMK